MSFFSKKTQVVFLRNAITLDEFDQKFGKLWRNKNFQFAILRTVQLAIFMQKQIEYKMNDFPVIYEILAEDS